MAPRNEENDWQVNCPDVRLRITHLHRTREWADCSFQFPGDPGAEDSKDSLYAHKLILAMASPVFAAMFYGNVGDTESPVIISDIDRPILSALLCYIYTDKVNIPDAECAISLYIAAHKYILIHLQKECVEFLLTALKDPNNVCQIYEFANFFDEKKLQEECLKQFSTKTQLILKSSSFQYADPNTVKKIFSMDSLDIESEMDLFNALTDYASHLHKPDDDTHSDSDSQHLASQLSKLQMDIGKDDKQTCNEANDNIARPSENIDLQLCKNKPEDLRKIMKDIIKEIRFLTISPADFAKICETTLLLSKDEMLALFANLNNPNSKLPMPDGFSTVRDLRGSGEGAASTVRDKRGIGEGAATFKHTFYEMSRMPILYNKLGGHRPFRSFRLAAMRDHCDRDRRLTSPLYYVSDLFWMIIATKSHDFLKLELLCENFEHGILFCKAKGELRLLSVCPDTEPKSRSFEHTFKKEETSLEFLFECSDVSRPNSKYIKDDSITVEVQLVAEPVPLFVKRCPPMFTAYNNINK